MKVTVNLFELDEYTISGLGNKILSNYSASSKEGKLPDFDRVIGMLSDPKTDDLLTYLDSTKEFVEYHGVEKYLVKGHDGNYTLEVKKPKNDLTNQDGNVFNLLGLTQRVLIRKGFHDIAEMLYRDIEDNAIDYNHALRKIMSVTDVVHNGNYVPETDDDEEGEENV